MNYTKNNIIGIQFTIGGIGGTVYTITGIRSHDDYVLGIPCDIGSLGEVLRFLNDKSWIVKTIDYEIY